MSSISGRSCVSGMPYLPSKQAESGDPHSKPKDTSPFGDLLARVSHQAVLNHQSQILPVGSDSTNGLAVQTEEQCKAGNLVPSAEVRTKTLEVLWPTAKGHDFSQARIEISHSAGIGLADRGHTAKESSSIPEHAVAFLSATKQQQQIVKNLHETPSVESSWGCWVAFESLSASQISSSSAGQALPINSRAQTILYSSRPSVKEAFDSSSGVPTELGESIFSSDFLYLKAFAGISPANTHACLPWSDSHAELPVESLGDSHAEVSGENLLDISAMAGVIVLDRQTHFPAHGDYSLGLPYVGPQLVPSQERMSLGGNPDNEYLPIGLESSKTLGVISTPSDFPLSKPKALALHRQSFSPLCAEVTIESDKGLGTCQKSSLRNRDFIYTPQKEPVAELPRLSEISPASSTSSHVERVSVVSRPTPNAYPTQGPNVAAEEENSEVNFFIAGGKSFIHATNPAPISNIESATQALSPIEQIMAVISRAAHQACNESSDASISPENCLLGKVTNLRSSLSTETLSVQLSPSQYGTISISIRLSGKQLDIRLEAESKEIALNLDKDKDTLAGKLGSAGYAIRDLSIVVTGLRTAQLDSNNSTLAKRHDHPEGGQANRDTGNNDAPKGWEAPAHPTPPEEAKELSADDFSGAYVYL